MTAELYLKGDNAEIVEDSDDEALEVDVGDLARLLAQLCHLVVGQVQIRLQKVLEIKDF